MIRPIEWLDNRLRLLDQTELPQKEIYLEFSSYIDVITAIKELKVRGAPAIGISSAYGIALGALSIKANDKARFIEQLQVILDDFAGARPTAVNLFHTIRIMKKVALQATNIVRIKHSLVETALAIQSFEENAMNRLSNFGAAILKNGWTVLTHCNTGTLATGVSYGTAIGVIQAAVEHGKNIEVYVDETRPLLQGARLTAWELSRLGIPHTLITDSMAGHFLHEGQIDCVIVGADRIACNGDTANKIGTYSIAVISRENLVPFYVAAPTSSIDVSIKSGASIPIEERKPEEVTTMRGVTIAPPGTHVANPAFDITPSKYIAGIITEKGIIKKPFTSNIKSIIKEDL